MRNLWLSFFLGRSSSGPGPSPGTPSPCASEASAPSSPAAPAPRAGRAEALGGDLDEVMGALARARADAGGLARTIAELETDAARVPALTEERDDLARKLEERERALATAEAKGEELARDLARAREELARSESRLDAAMRERGGFLREAEEGRERIRALGETIERLTRAGEAAEAVREKSEIEIAGLRTALGEREKALEEARNALAEARIAAQQGAQALAQEQRDSAEKARRIGELSDSLAAAQRREDELAEANDTLREETRTLELARADLAIALETKAYALTGELSQERGGHEVTRRLLDETRDDARALAEENRNLKEQSVAMAREAEQMKLELGSMRSAIRDYGDRLGEANRRFSGAQDENARLETALAEARKDARAANRKAERLARAERENDELHEKLRALQESLAHARGAGREADGGPDRGEAGSEPKLIAFPAPGAAQEKVTLSAARERGRA
ncbi:hypothetical protein [Erythrobacter sp.]|uniref:hypothetical protein n=1 Tax=Erythrobacter sp. TaxID=1042 RepID=UPI001425E5B2|nr:hypothetical protein [Erythrobacter sp.]QIQ86487.1 MAG: hypothetical protein G9473_07135 [Erythrobacter sp.]